MFTFFNAGAADFFMKENKTKWDSEKKVNVREDNDKRERSSIVKKGEIELENRDIDVYSFGIGGYFGDKEMEKLAQIWN